MDRAALLIYELFLWALAIFNCVCTLLYLLDTLEIMRRVKLSGRPCAVGAHDSLTVTPFCLPVLWAVFDCAPPARLPFALGIGFWLFNVICAILQKKLASLNSWRGYLEGIVKSFFGFFSSARGFMICLERKLTGTIRAIIFLGVMAVSVVAALTGSGALMVASSASYILVLFYSGASAALHSCRKLLVFWLVHGVYFSVAVLALLQIVIETSDQFAAAYSIFVVVFSLLWLLAAGVADDDVAKMAAMIINTGTTILLVVINVLAGWVLNGSTPSPVLKETIEGLQYYSIIILLPLVAAGYLAALLKEAQIYWKKRHSDE